MLSKIQKMEIIKNGYSNLPDYLKKILMDKYPKLQLGGNLNINININSQNHLSIQNSKIDIHEIYVLYTRCLDYLNIIRQYPQQENQIKQLMLMKNIK